MKKNGYTLIELLAVILLLGIITSISAYSVSRFSDAVKERTRKNLITRIEIAASNYGADNDVKAVLVDDLIKSGYLTADNAADELLDPVSNEKLNCYAVKIEKRDNYYKAKFISDNQYVHEGECDPATLQNQYVSLKILVKVNGNLVDPKKGWIKESGILYAIKDNDVDQHNFECNPNICSWNSSSGASGVRKIMEFNAEGEYNVKYTFIYSPSTEYFKTSVILRIDSVAPRINNVTNNEGILTINVTENGSGVKALCISNVNSYSSCDWEYVSGLIFKNSTPITSSGSYYVFVKDNADNISNSKWVSVLIAANDIEDGRGGKENTDESAFNEGIINDKRDTIENGTVKS